jgi:hypothetical protein
VRRWAGGVNCFGVGEVPLVGIGGSDEREDVRLAGEDGRSVPSVTGRSSTRSHHSGSVLPSVASGTMFVRTAHTICGWCSSGSTPVVHACPATGWARSGFRSIGMTAGRAISSTVVTAEFPGRPVAATPRAVGSGCWCGRADQTRCSPTARPGTDRSAGTGRLHRGANLFVAAEFGARPRPIGHSPTAGLPAR